MNRRYFFFFAIPVRVVLLWYVARKPRVEDWRHGNGVCEVHGTQMRTEEVHGLAGTISFLPEYMEVASEFPNAGIEYGEELYSSRVGKIHVCSECESARQSWIQQNLRE